jgi:predicted nucleic acid-binding Zn ribbon protein
VKRTAPRPLSAALDSALRQAAPPTLLARVQSSWAEAAGSAVAAEAQPVSERDGVVTVACSSAIWAQELDLLGPDLLGRLNARLGGSSPRDGVRRLRFVAGS